MLLLAALLGAAFALWPQPHSVVAGDGTVAVCPNFQFQSTQSNTLVDRAFARYQRLIFGGQQVQFRFARAAHQLSLDAQEASKTVKYQRSCAGALVVTMRDPTVTTVELGMVCLCCFGLECL